MAAERGSDHLRSRPLDLESISKVWEFIDGDEETILEQWWLRGQPGPDWIVGAVRVGPTEVGRVLSELLGHGAPARLHVSVFPYGVPVVDNYRVNFNGPTEAF